MIKHIEHDDDIPVGRVLRRREMLALLAGGAGGLLLTACGDATQSSSASTPAATTTSQATTAAATTQAATTAATSQAATTAAASTTASNTTNAATTTATSTTDAATTASASTASQLSCVVVPQLTEGPYFVDEKLNRSDIRSDPTDGTVKDGAMLKLTFNVSNVGTGGNCTPYTGAYVDIWHCDATGVYSDVTDNMEGFATVGKKFLRGYQVTDANGQAAFTTIYPGWYQGRTVHIHFKVRNALGANQSHTFTSQLFFDDTLSDQVFVNAPYASKGTRQTKNANDNIYQQGGTSLLLNVKKEGNVYTATFNLGVQIA